MVAEFLGCLVGVALRTTRTGFESKAFLYGKWSNYCMKTSNMKEIYSLECLILIEDLKYLDRYCTSTRLSY